MRLQFISLARWVIRSGGRVLCPILPLPARKALVGSAICRKTRGGLEFSLGVLDDFRRRDPEALHRFLWSSHLAYARSYEIPQRFGESNLNPTRRILVQDIIAYLHSRGLDARKHIRSIFDLGCSMGYLLRYLEVEICPSAGILHGLDIDSYAIKTGMAHLLSLQSKVKLFIGDITSAEYIMGNHTYDLVLCCGVLMYVNQVTAERVIRTMLSRARRLAGIICLACPEHKGIACGRSTMRSWDGTFIHNVDQMILQSGGRVVSSKWVGTSVSGSSPSLVILAEPASGLHAGKSTKA